MHSAKMITPVGCCRLLEIVTRCLEEDVAVFKGSIQTVVDSVEVSPSHPCHVESFTFHWQ